MNHAANGLAATAATNSSAASAVIPAGRDYGFPFPPYSIQVGLMDTLYRVLDQRGVGLLESPTGTGKSLSLICGSFTWLRDNLDNSDVLVNVNETILLGSEPAAVAHVATESTSLSNEPAWIRERAAKLVRDRKLEQVRQYRAAVQARINKVRASSRASRHNDGSEDGAAPKRRRGAAAKKPSASDVDDDELVIDYDSDTDTSTTATATIDGLQLTGKAAELTAALAKMRGADEAEDPDADMKPPDLRMPQILYVSRTHSQISQFVREFRGTKHAADFPVISLASRKNLCINDTVLKASRGSASRINDMCLDLQKQAAGTKGDAKAKASKGCPHLEKGMTSAFRDHALAEVHDIEDLASLGRRLNACPYYGARAAVDAASLVAMPYTALISSDTRSSLGVRVRGNVVVVDEAHNLADAINQAHSAEVDGAQIERGYNQLARYLAKYRNRLKPGNRVYVQQLMAVLAAVHGFLKKRAAPPAGTAKTSELMHVDAFIFALEVDHINLFKLATFLRDSQLPRKLLGFVEKYEAPPAGTATSDTMAADTMSRHISPLAVFERLLTKLIAPDADGRVLYLAPAGSGPPTLKYLALNPAGHFADIVRDAHALVFAGGTMQPVSDFTDFLIPDTFGKPLEMYSCGHVIPRENLAALVVPRSPAGRTIRFTLEGRKDPQLLPDVCQTICNLVNVVPRGMVVFLPSFQLLDDMTKAFREEGYAARIERKKRIFTEPREAVDLERVLREYAQHIDESPTSGALLLSVVGGKMSEGINFSGPLARCVVMVGIPYPNLGSAELEEKLKYIDGLRAGASKEFYENLAMRAVNQSIGRAIRNRMDYAAVVLVDVRYEGAAVRRKLPAWIAETMAPPDPGRPFSHAVQTIARFFKIPRDACKVFLYD
ncbi:ATP-dependent DNA helicase chl1 [Blastocladiella emersonii ATCC 22665]|nr:ATP-dependent DNA helicase chl1 [Blastocladiella emersonii ATCC 22665]